MGFDPAPTPLLLEAVFGGADSLRRRYGEILDTLGFGPVTTPSRIIFSLPGMRLRDYGGPADAPALVIIAAPFKRACIWDLAPQASVIRQLSRRLSPLRNRMGRVSQTATMHAAEEVCLIR